MPDPNNASDGGTNAEGSPQTSETEEKKTPESSESKPESEQAPKEDLGEAGEKEKEGEEEGGEPEVVDLKSVKPDADGNLVWIANPEDPKHSTVYKGKTLDELFENVGKGITAKDSYIRELKSRGLPVKPGRRADGTTDDGFNVQFPDQREILERVLKTYRLDPNFLSYSREDWKAYEVQNGAVETIEMKQLVKEVRRAADAEFSQANVQAINDASLEEETQAVEEVLADYGISAADFEDKYDELLAGIYKNKENFNPNGVRKNGRIVAEATKAIRKIFETKVVDATSKKKDEESALNRGKKLGVKVDGPGQKPSQKPADKHYKSTEDVVADLMKSYKP